MIFDMTQRAEGSQLNVQPRKRVTISANTTLVPLDIMPDFGYDVMQEVEATVNVPTPLKTQTEAFASSLTWESPELSFTPTHILICCTEPMAGLTASATHLIYAATDGTTVDVYGLRTNGSATDYAVLKTATVTFTSNKVTVAITSYRFSATDYYYAIW